MSVKDKKILQEFSVLFEGLSFNSKLELIEWLVNSLKTNTLKENNFYQSFGAFASEKSAEEIISEIKFTRKFKIKNNNNLND